MEHLVVQMWKYHQRRLPLHGIFILNHPQLSSESTNTLFHLKFIYPRKFFRVPQQQTLQIQTASVVERRGHPAQWIRDHLMRTLMLRATILLTGRYHAWSSLLMSWIMHMHLLIVPFWSTTWLRYLCFLRIVWFFYRRFSVLKMKFGLCW